jgi:hypothetical protein
MPVGPRVSKEEFMHALGLNPQDPHHEQYYRAMRVSVPAESLTLTFFPYIPLPLPSPIYKYTTDIRRTL